ncbi:MAG: type II toxin-antitoxin system VapC family toxin, partial [Verrucomicrobiota bacterium]
MSGFLLDTNVVSELRKGAKANSNVLTWARAVDQRQLFISVLVFGEIRKGIETLRRKDPVQAQALEKWLEGLRSMFSERNLPITDQIADIWGKNSADMP